MEELQRPNPEQLLRQLEAEERRPGRGRLKVFLGYAGGVGKSFRMLDEGRRRQARGEDVVVGAVQASSPPEVDALIQKMEVIPLRTVDGTPVMDVEAILRRHPQVCLVDSLAYDNPTGSSNAKRWQDVEHLLEAGISIIATINLQYVEEQQGKVERITGKRPAESVPQVFLSAADEIEVVDAPPEMALERLGESSDSSDDSALRARQLSELRELALLLAADVVDHQLEDYLRRQGIEQLWGTQERIMVWVQCHADAANMIASGKRNADRFRGEFYAAYLNEPDLSPEEKDTIQKNLAYASTAGAQIESLDAEDHVEAILEFAGNHGITQIFVQRDTHISLWERLLGSSIDRLINAAEGIDVRVFPH